MTKENKKIAYSVGVVLVLIGFLYVVSYAMRGDGTLSDKDLKITETSKEVVVDNSAVTVEPTKMYLGMKTWTWVKTKAKDGTVTTPAGDKPFTLTFDFNKSIVSVGTDCNSANGIFSAKSGVVLFGELASTKMYCEGSQESVFEGYLAATQRFYFSSHGELVLTMKDGGTVTLK